MAAPQECCDVIEDWEKESGWLFLCLTRIGVCICPGGQHRDEVMPSVSSQQAEDPPAPPLPSLGDAGPCSGSLADATSLTNNRLVTSALRALHALRLQCVERLFF